MEINNIYCGDCLTLLKQLSNNEVDYVVTSPPYNTSGSIGSPDNIRYEDYTDDLNTNQYYDFLVKVIDELLRVTSKEVFFNIQYLTDNKSCVFRLIGKYHNNIKDIIIWHKRSSAPSIGRSRLTHNYEFFIVLSNNNTSRNYDKDFGLEGKHTTCFIAETNNPITNKESFNITEHTAIMSLPVARHIITNFTDTNSLVLDPFMGTGTTAVVCKQLKRNYIGFDISDKYIKIANDRLSQTNIIESIIPMQTKQKEITCLVDEDKIKVLLDKYPNLISRSQAIEMILNKSVEV